MAFSGDDLFEILNEDGTPTGRIKKRALVHQDGDLHGASHIFVVRLHQGRIQVLLQKRSQSMDSFPGWNDYVERIEKNWNKIVTNDDTVVIAGDISWAMKLEKWRD